MEPLLRDRRGLTVYLAAWVLVSVAPASLVAPPGEGRFLAALVAAAPAAVLFGLAALPLHYICGALPLRPASAGRVLRVHATLAAAWSVLWLLLLDGSARLADALGPPAPGSLAGEVERRAGALLAVGAVLYLGVVALHYLELGARRERAAERRAMAASLQAREAQLAALQAQIHPHFLFNSLNAISALTVEQPRLARQLCISLAEFLRGSLAVREGAWVSLDEELRLARAYLEVERVRLGERLAIEVRVAPPAGEVPVPALLLQPLVENAVTHGVATLAEGGTLAIEAHATPATLVVTVTNPFDPDAPPRRAGRGSGGVGLANVSRRIAACYHGADLSTRREAGRFTATLVLPRTPREAPDGARAAQGPDRR